jgi:hypothetical protein
MMMQTITINKQLLNKVEADKEYVSEFTEVNIDLKVTKFTAEYAECGSHEVSIKAEISLSNIQELLAQFGIDLQIESDK